MQLLVIEIGGIKADSLVELEVLDMLDPVPAPVAVQPPHAVSVVVEYPIIISINWSTVVFNRASEWEILSSISRNASEKASISNCSFRLWSDLVLDNCEVEVEDLIGWGNVLAFEADLKPRKLDVVSQAFLGTCSFIWKDDLLGV